MINTSLFDLKDEKDKELYMAVVEFNSLYKKFPKEIASWTYYELSQKSRTDISLALWKEFYTDSRVQAWYKEELDLALDAKLQKLVGEVGENHSTATNQTLQSILKYKEDNSNKTDSTKIFIYTFMPLSEVEEQLDNVKIINNIPKEIKNAITIFKGDQSD